MVIERTSFPLVYPSSICRVKGPAYTLVGLFKNGGCLVGEIRYKNFQFLESFHSKTLWLPVFNHLTAMGAVVLTDPEKDRSPYLVAFNNTALKPRALPYNYITEEKPSSDTLNLENIFVLTEIQPYSYLISAYSHRKENHSRQSLDLEAKEGETECRNGSCALHFTIELFDTWHYVGLKTGTPTEVLVGPEAIKFAWGSRIRNRTEVSYSIPEERKAEMILHVIIETTDYTFHAERKTTYMDGSMDYKPIEGRRRKTYILGKSFTRRNAEATPSLVNREPKTNDTSSNENPQRESSSIASDEIQFDVFRHFLLPCIICKILYGL